MLVVVRALIVEFASSYGIKEEDLKLLMRFYHRYAMSTGDLNAISHAMGYVLHPKAIPELLERIKRENMRDCERKRRRGKEFERI